ncbi:LON peptidase substrate-binding domain-containing protein [Candidatus Laterigemmans baculatus]|uniref:LON peptidase substrate-binding domain-containing protein n=1 Tax=Candidatus Laterigemmans baculatus TaxID=2770505 RepID=UPI0013D8FFA8|nr:LON peptidase substrate-binding domain-containing protein [Candidatus Laterigemmans baculatus]
MADLEQMTELPPDFDGRVRLFPLPELVVFPHAMQPLHIFEPRYRELLEDALAGDRLIAMATLAPGWEKSGVESVLGEPPPLEPHVCICRIVSHTASEDELHNILLIGMRRAVIIDEEETARPFRTAKVQVQSDIYPADGTLQRAQLKRQLLDAFRELIPNVAEVQKNLHELMASQMKLGAITDIIGFTMHFEVAQKIALLAESDVDGRARMLIKLLGERVVEGQESPGKGEDGGFPPAFSLN